MRISRFKGHHRWHFHKTNININVREWCIIQLIRTKDGFSESFYYTYIDEEIAKARNKRANYRRKMFKKGKV